MAEQTNSPVVTDAAYRRLAEIIAADGGEKSLRIAVMGGGCSGFQYKFELAEAAEEEDLVLEKDGIAVLIDPVSLPFLAGAVIDYKNELIGARFSVDNPNVASECGCGTSFSI